MWLMRKREIKKKEEIEKKKYFKEVRTPVLDMRTAVTFTYYRHESRDKKIDEKEERSQQCAKAVYVSYYNRLLLFF